MTSSRIAVFAVVLCVVTFLLGCTGHQRLYGGPALPPDKVAVIKGTVGILPGSTSLSIMYVDGRQLSPYAEQVEVLPGRHVLGVQYHLNLGGGGYAKGEVAVDAKPGKSYQLESKSDRNIVTFSIVEARDNK